MHHNKFEYTLRNKNVTRVVEALEFMDELILRGTNTQILNDISDAFVKRYRSNIVVNGNLIPAVAKAFKAKGYEISLVKSAGVICYATISITGEDVVIYMDEKAGRMLAKRFLDRNINKLHPYLQKVVNPLVAKLLG